MNGNDFNMSSNRVDVVMRKPSALHPWAEEILLTLAQHPSSEEIVLGGYFALQHYLEYRKTNDIDAWWRSRANPQTLTAIRAVMAEVGMRHGFSFKERQFGETYSFEWEQDGTKVFSFQIAVRSLELDPAVPSFWPPIKIETLRDNIAAKMNALVDRGAPRDFVDIERVVKAGFFKTDECWQLWSQKNKLAPIEPARQKVMFHLSAVEMRRTLESISNDEERAATEQRRLWYKNEFLKG